MKPPVAFRYLLSCVCLLAAIASPADAARHALLIGVAEYENPEANLRFPGKDVENFRNYLVRQHGFEPAEIRTLLNAEATAADIGIGMRELVSKAEPGDSVVIYFSGHGTQVVDLEGDEPDGLDESLCPQDFESGDPDTHFTDDTLRKRLGELKTDRVLVVLDCCHSGTGTRVGGNPAKQGIRMMPSPFHPGPPQSVRGRLGAAMKSAIRSDAGMKHLLIAGCASDEYSYESGQIGGGLMTSALIAHASGANIDQPLGVLSGKVRNQALEWMRQLMPDRKPQNVSFEGGAAGTIRELLAKDGPRIEVVKPPMTELATDQAKEVVLKVAADKEVYQVGEKVRVSVTADKACYLRLYYTDTDGKSYLIFPNKFHQDDKVDGGSTVELGGEKSPFQFQTTFPEGFDGSEVGEVGEVFTAVACTAPFNDKIGNWGESHFEEIPGVGRGALTTRGVRIERKPGIAVTSYRIRR